MRLTYTKLCPMELVIYIHILSATAWVGGSLLLFTLGITIRDKEAQKNVYKHIGPLYGYFETFWLITLWITGIILYEHHGFSGVFKYAYDSLLSQTMIIKVYFVMFLTFVTLIHLVIAFKTHQKERSKFLTIISRGSSMMIFLLNFVVLWFAISVRSQL